MFIDELKSLTAAEEHEKAYLLVKKHEKQIRSTIADPFLMSLINMRYLFAVGRICFTMKDYDLANQCYAALIAVYPANASLHFEYARGLNKRPDPDAAIRHLKRASILSPPEPGVTKVLADVLDGQGRLKESVRQYKAALIVNPEDKEARFALSSVSLLRASETTKPERPVRWPRYISEFVDLPDAIEKFVANDVIREKLIRPGTNVFTMGSCFARHLATNLKKQCSTVNVFYLRANEDINNTNAIRYIVEALLDSKSKHHSVVEAYFGLDYLAELRQQLSTIDVLIYTLGVAPGFFDRKTGDYVIPVTRDLGMRELTRGFDFRSTTVSENVDNICMIFDELFKMNPNLRIVLTLSPVPLKVSFEHNSPIVADCLSKSTLRVAAEEVVQKYDGRVLYWPSFEIVRWLAPVFGPAFGKDDNAARHVSLDVIESVTDAFIGRLAAPEVRDAR